MDTAQEFTVLNFKVSDYTDPTGRKLPMYYITRDGFTLLAMGFTGAKAMQFKISYIEAFNTMERKLAEEHSHVNPALPLAGLVQTLTSLTNQLAILLQPQTIPAPAPPLIPQTSHEQPLPKPQQIELPLDVPTMPTSVKKAKRYAEFSVTSLRTACRVLLPETRGDHGFFPFSNSS